MTSLMLEEALSAAAVASRQLAVLDACLPALGQRLREVDPNLALTVARGSSTMPPATSPTWPCSTPACRWPRCPCR